MGFAIGYGLAWLLVRLPARIILRNRMVEPIVAWLITEKKSGGREGISLVIAIPNKDFSGKFASLNGVAV